MDDLISRQAALNAMETWDKFGCDPDGKLVRYDDDKHYIPYVHYEDMVHAIKHLPSAQPEQRYTEEELRVFQHGISLSLLSKRSSQHWRYDEDTATEIKFLERLYEKVGTSQTKRT